MFRIPNRGYLELDPQKKESNESQEDTEHALKCMSLNNRNVEAKVVA